MEKWFTSTSLITESTICAKTTIRAKEKSWSFEEAIEFEHKNKQLLIETRDRMQFVFENVLTLLAGPFDYVSEYASKMDNNSKFAFVVFDETTQECRLVNERNAHAYVHHITGKQTMTDQFLKGNNKKNKKKQNNNNTKNKTGIIESFLRYGPNRIIYRQRKNANVKNHTNSNANSNVTTISGDNVRYLNLLLDKMITDYENENENENKEQDGTSLEKKSFATHYYAVFYQGKKYAGINKDDCDVDSKLQCANFFIKDVTNNLNAIKDCNKDGMILFSKDELKQLLGDEENDKKKEEVYWYIVGLRETEGPSYEWCMFVDLEKELINHGDPCYENWTHVNKKRFDHFVKQYQTDQSVQGYWQGLGKHNNCNYFLDKNCGGFDEYNSNNTNNNNNMIEHEMKMTQFINEMNCIFSIIYHNALEIHHTKLVEHPVNFIFLDSFKNKTATATTKTKTLDLFGYGYQMRWWNRPNGDCVATAKKQTNSFSFRKIICSVRNMENNNNNNTPKTTLQGNEGDLFPRFNQTEFNMIKNLTIENVFVESEEYPYFHLMRLETCRIDKQYFCQLVSKNNCNNISSRPTTQLPPRYELKDMFVKKQIEMFGESNKNENYPYYEEKTDDEGGVCTGDDDCMSVIKNFDFFDFEYLFVDQFSPDMSMSLAQLNVQQAKLQSGHKVRYRLKAEHDVTTKKMKEIRLEYRLIQPSYQLYGNHNNNNNIRVNWQQIKTDNLTKCISSTDCGYMVYKPQYDGNRDKFEINFIFGDKQRGYCKLNDIDIKEKYYSFSLKCGIGKEKVKVIIDTLGALWNSNKLFCVELNYDYGLKRFEFDCQLNRICLNRNDEILNKKWFNTISDKCDNGIKLQAPLAQLLLQDRGSIEFDSNGNGNNNNNNNNSNGNSLVSAGQRSSQVSLEFLLQFSQMFLEFLEYSLTARNNSYHTGQYKNFFGDDIVHPVFIVSNNPIEHLLTITNNVIEEQDIGISLIDAIKSSSTLYQLINTIKNDLLCRFVTSDGFNVVFFRIDCQFRVYRITRNYHKPGILLTPNQANQVPFKGFLVYYSPIYSHNSNNHNFSNGEKYVNNVVLQLTQIHKFKQLYQLFHFQKNPKWYVLCNYNYNNDNTYYYWQPYPCNQQQIIDSAYYGPGSATVQMRANDHATYSVYVGQSGSSQYFYGQQSLPSKQQLKEYQGNTCWMPSGQQISLNGFQQQVIYSIPVDGVIGGVGIACEETFETNFTLSYQEPAGVRTEKGRTTRRNDNLAVKCLGDIFYLLPFTIKHDLHDGISVNDGIIEDCGCVQQCFVKTAETTTAIEEYGYLVRSAKYPSVYYEMSALDMNRCKIKSKNIVEYLCNERKNKIDEHQQKIYQLLYNKKTIATTVENLQDSCNDDVKGDDASAPTERNESSIFLFKDLLFLPKKEDYPNPIHLISTAICEGIAQSRKALIENSDILKNKEQFKEELMWYGGINIWIVKTCNNKHQMIENVLNTMKEKDLVENVTKCDNSNSNNINWRDGCELDWAQWDDIFSNVLENAHCRSTNNNSSKNGNCSANQVLLVTINESYDSHNEETVYQSRVSYVFDLKQERDPKTNGRFNIASKHVPIDKIPSLIQNQTLVQLLKKYHVLYCNDLKNISIVDNICKKINNDVRLKRNEKSYLIQTLHGLSHNVNLLDKNKVTELFGRELHTNSKLTQVARNGELLQHYFHVLHKSDMRLAVSDIFESSMIVSYNPLESYVFSCLDQAPMNTVSTRQSPLNTKNKMHCKPKLLPFYDLCKPIFSVSDMYYMSYQSNLLSKDELADIRTSGSLTTKDLETSLGTSNQSNISSFYTITRAIYDFLFPDKNEYEQAQDAIFQESVMNLTPPPPTTETATTTTKTVDEKAEELLKQHYDIPCTIIIIPASVQFDEESTFFTKYCLDIAPVFSDMKHWTILFLYKGKFFAYLPYQEFTDLSDDATMRKVYNLRTNPIAVMQRLNHEAEQFQVKLEKEKKQMEISDKQQHTPDDNENENEHGKEDSCNRYLSKIDRPLWFEKRMKVDGIDTYLELCARKSFKMIKIFGHDENEAIKREIPISFGGEERKRDEMEEDIANELFFSGSDCKIASSNEDEEISQELECSICKEVLNQPCGIGDNECKHRFCQICIENWAEMGQRRDQSRGSTCPMCRRKIVKISKDNDKEKEIKNKTPSIYYKQCQIENDAMQTRPKIVKLHQYTEHMTAVGDIRV